MTYVNGNVALVLPLCSDLMTASQITVMNAEVVRLAFPISLEVDIPYEFLRVCLFSDNVMLFMIFSIYALQQTLWLKRFSRSKWHL